MSILKTTIRWVLSVGIFVLAAIVGHRLWVYYNSEPWTRDARVRADVAEIAPDVSGLVDTVNVIDNQTVKVGDVLFTIDKRRFEIAKSRAIDAVNQLNVEIAQARRENLRNKHLDDLVSDEGREESQAKLDQEIAARDQAQTALEEAELNLTRSEVKSPIDGIITNIELQPGDYATTGKPEFAILATDSVRIEGYFEETKLRDIHDRASSSRFLANINPTFNWVRLAQRIPVRIKVDQKPADLALLSGRTATVRILPDAKGAP
jgi:RND family efflux transporter MFP subunit